MTKTKMIAVCRYCGSDDVLADAFARWNVDGQQWEIGDVYDKGAFCHKCDGETRVEFKPAQREAA